MTVEPYLSDWKLDGGVWRTVGEEPPGGWYLRSRRQCDLDRVSFSVSKEKEDGIVYLYTTDWRVLLRRNRIYVKYSGLIGVKRCWTKYWYTVNRSMDFPAGSWHDLQLKLDGEYLRVDWDGKEVVRWNSPAGEWTERVRSCDKLSLAGQYCFPDRLPPSALEGENQIIVLHAYKTPVSFRGIEFVGVDQGPAQGFHDPSHPPRPYTKVDTHIEALLPIEPVEVTWALKGEDAREAAKLPAVSQWNIEERAEIDGMTEGERGQRLPVRYFVGAAQPGPFPQTLYSIRGWPQSVSIYFNLEKAGAYTLKNEWGSGDIGQGGTVFEVSVDDKAVSRVVYRALDQDGTVAPVKDYVPLVLSEGPHRIDLRFSTDLVFQIFWTMKYQYVKLGPLALVPGIEEPFFEYEAPHIDEPEALKSEPKIGEQAGKIIKYCITNLKPGGKYTAKLVFYDVEAVEPGQRAMDIYANGKQVEEGLDVVEDAGWTTYLEKAYELTAQTAVGDQAGHIEIKLVAKRFKAFLNALKVVDGSGKVVFHQNCGWDQSLVGSHARPSYNPSFSVTPISAEPPIWTPEELFDGHNLVANPHFSQTDDRGKASAWYSGKELLELAKSEDGPQIPLEFYNILQGDGEYGYDEKVGHDHAGSLRIGKTGEDFGVTCNGPAVDYGKSQKFGFYVKTEGATGRVWPEIYWFATNMNAGSPLPAPRLQLIGKSKGEPGVTGTSDWQQLAVEVRPPFGAVFAMLAVRVEANSSGSIWIDDAEFNGYGAEPLEITYSHLGYHPKSDKSIVVKSLSEGAVKWQLLRAKSGEVVKSGDAEYHSYEWFSKRHYYRFDLTGFEEPGSYELRVMQDEHTFTTDDFRVDKEVYRDFSRIALCGLYIKRFNLDIPGGHEPEALEDSHCIVSRDFPRYNSYEYVFLPERKELLGGYYDAGDEMKHMEFWPAVLFAACNAYQLIRPAPDDRTPNDCLDEMLWAYQAFHKCQTDEGAFYTRLFPYALYTENIPFYGTDRYLSNVYALPQAAGVSAMGSYILKDVDKALSSRYLQVAERNYDFNRLWDKATNEEKLNVRFLCVSKALFAEMYLWKLTGEEKYKERMDAHARIVAEGLKAKAYRGAPEIVSADDVGGISQDFVIVPCLFAQMYPDHPTVGKILEGLRTFAADVKRVSSYSPWGQARDLSTPEGQEPERWPKNERSIAYWPTLAYSLSQVGMMLKDVEIIRLAERQLQWCLGKNFADLSMIHGVGQRMVAGGDYIYDQVEFFEAWLAGDRKLFYYDGCVPTLAFREMGKGQIEISKGDGWFPAIHGYPRGYYYYWVQANYPIHAEPTEYWLPQTTPLVMAAAAVQAAVQSLE